MAPLSDPHGSADRHQRDAGSARTPRIEGEITAERFARLTSHLRVNGKPIESVLLRLEAERKGGPV